MIEVHIPYSNQTGEEFATIYGKRFEQQLRSISHPQAEVEKVEASYDGHTAKFEVFFVWGASNQIAKKEVEIASNSFASILSEDSRNGMDIWASEKNSGFFAMSFYSEKRDLNALYDVMEPVLAPKLARVRDASNPVLWNPSRREVRVTLKPEIMASLQLFPSDIERSVQAALSGRTGGSITVGLKQFSIEMPRQIQTLEQLKQTLITTPSGRSVHLSDVANLDIGPRTTDSRIFKTSGVSSLILFSQPKPGGNVKQMSEELLQVVKETLPSLPSDVKWKVLVDPSEFIRSSVNNVFHEVGVAALLAVIVLFLFIGSVRNVITAAIEIPLSMVLAFILMRISGMNLNLISLGGLALSAGMNVDASVVVMENIFRHFDKYEGPLDFQKRLQITVEAVKEVQFAVIASTISSLVVFLPLVFTSDLSYAILGDLALAVVFSHGFSAFVALLLVPTVRLHLMQKGGQQHSSSPIEGYLKKLETLYSSSLSKFLERPKLRYGTYAGLGVGLILLASIALPTLPREVIGKPDTDWLLLGVITEGNALIQQMEIKAEEVERDLLNRFGKEIQYTFTQIHGPNDSMIMARLKDKSKVRELQKKFEETYTNSPSVRHWVDSWNPSELPIPHPPQFEVSVRGGTPENRMNVAKDLRDLMEGKKLYPRISTNPSVEPEKVLFINPHQEQWLSLREQGYRFSPHDVIDLLRVGTTGRRIGYFPIGAEDANIMLRYPSQYVSSVEELAAFPVGIGSKLVALKALSEIKTSERPPTIFKEDGRELYYVKGYTNTGEERKNAQILPQAEKLVRDWNTERMKSSTIDSPLVAFEDPAKDLTDAIRQLGTAVAISIGLIYLTMLIQFGSWVEPLLVLVAIPLGFIGVLLSLLIFQSTLSLNSILGVILLNGIAVANSIILVDFIKRLVAEGLSPREAAVQAAKKRLRPILITSLTTVLGMLPIAIGAGEGGRILQPLGIAVAGGLWISMLLTLFLVPALQVAYLEWTLDKERGSLFALIPVALSRIKMKTFLLVLLIAGNVLATVEVAPQLSFQEAVNAIVERSTSVGIQKETKESVEARNWSSKYRLLPTVTLSATEARYKVINTAEVEKRTYQAVGNLNILRFGADIAAMSAAMNENESEEYLVADSILKAEEEGTGAIFGYIHAQALVKSLEANLKSREDAWKIGQERSKRGLLAMEEANKLLIDRSNAEAVLHDGEAERVNASERLVRLLSHQRVDAQWPWKETMPKVQTFFEKVDQKNLAERPDWKASETALDAAHARKRESLGQALPSVDLSVSYGDVNYQKPLPQVTGNEWQGMLTLTIPLFDRFSNFGAYRAAVHAARAQELRLESVRRLARSEWNTARESFSIALKSAIEREKTLDVSRKLYESNTLRFRRGIINANDLMIDQDRLYQAEVNAIKGWSAAHQKFVAACHALGERVVSCLEKTK